MKRKYTTEVTEEQAVFMKKIFGDVITICDLAYHENNIAYCQGRINKIKSESKNPWYWKRKLAKAEKELEEFNKSKEEIK